MKQVICLSLTDTLVKKIDNLRGDVSRSLFVEKLLSKTVTSLDIKGEAHE